LALAALALVLFGAYDSYPRKITRNFPKQENPLISKQENPSEKTFWSQDESTWTRTKETGCAVSGDISFAENSFRR